jgi:hypothetical protein
MQQQQQHIAYTFPPSQPAAAAGPNAGFAQTASASVSPVDQPHQQQNGQDVPYNLDPYLINLADTVNTAAGTTNTTEKAKVAFVHSWSVGPDFPICQSPLTE